MWQFPVSIITSKSMSLLPLLLALRLLPPPPVRVRLMTSSLAFTCFHLLHICFGFPVVEAMEGGVDSLLISTSKFLFQRCCLFLKSSSVQTLLHSWNPDAAFISGSGKTFTMQPLPLRAAEDLVRLLRQPVYHNQRFKLWLSFFEIYGGKLFDLLSERKLVFPCSNWFITFFFLKKTVFRTWKSIRFSL